MKPSLPYLFVIALITIFAPAHAQEIVDIYSDLQSCDVTIEGDAKGCLLGIDLSFEGRRIQSETFTLDGPGTWIAMWNVPKTEEGPYAVCARLENGEETISQRCFDFYYGGRSDIRFDVRDFHADQKGMNILIYSSDLAVVDIYYMLIQDRKALYVSKDDSVPISGSVRTPAEVNRVWKPLLENHQEYTGRIKIVEKRGGQTRAFMNSFIAKDNAEITDTYEDETGASATVMGESRVPFRGSLRFELYQDGEFITSVEEKTPVLLTNDDETVEISWEETLDPGIYQLKIYLLGNDGDVIDLAESIIEAEPRPQVAVVETPEGEGGDESSQSTTVIGAVILIAVVIVVYFVVKNRSG